MRQIYLDYNSTTPIAPSVQEAMQPFFTEHFGNPSSPYALGRACQEALEDARGQVASLLGADREEIVFTSGGTESNNLALLGVLLRKPARSGGHLVISALEHAAVAEPAKFLQRLGYAVTVVGCDRQGVIDVDALESALRNETVLVSIVHANHEVGVIQPLRIVSALCRGRGILLHTDAAQSVGKVRTNVDELGVDLLSFTGHKLYAPKGIGALYVRQGTALTPLMHGEGQESGLRPGTENVPYAVGLGKASVLAERSLEGAIDRMAKLRDGLWNGLRQAIGGGLTMNSARAERLPNTLSANFPGVSGAELLARLPELCASTGTSGASHALSLSPTLTAMGVSAEQGRGAVRLSVGWYTSEEEIERATNWLVGAWEALK